MKALESLIDKVFQMLQEGAASAFIAEKLSTSIDWVHSLADQEFMSDYSDYSRISEDNDE